MQHPTPTSVHLRCAPTRIVSVLLVQRTRLTIIYNAILASCCDSLTQVLYTRSSAYCSSPDFRLSRRLMFSLNTVNVTLQLIFPWYCSALYCYLVRPYHRLEHCRHILICYLPLLASWPSCVLVGPQRYCTPPTCNAALNQQQSLLAFQLRAPGGSFTSNNSWSRIILLHYRLAGKATRARPGC